MALVRRPAHLVHAKREKQHIRNSRRRWSMTFESGGRHFVASPHYSTFSKIVMADDGSKKRKLEPAEPGVVYFVTGNANKLREVQQILGNSLPVSSRTVDCA